MKRRRSNKKSWMKKILPINKEMYDFDLLPKVSTVDQRGCQDFIDRISELSDDILAYILSFLTLREATTAKILSTRWRGLCTMPNTILLKYPFPTKHIKGPRCAWDGYYDDDTDDDDEDDDDTDYDTDDDYTDDDYDYYEPGDVYYQIGDETQLSDHMKQVNHTLDSYTGSRVIKILRVDVSYTKKGYSKTNEKLLEFALSRETEIIDINVIYPEFIKFIGFSFLKIIKNGPGSSLPGIKCLKELSLSGVAMDNSDIRVLVSEFVALERLLLHSLEAKCAYTLDIDGPPTSKLKHLIISSISSKWICVSNLANLISFRCDGTVVEDCIIKLYNLVKLVDLRLHGHMDNILLGKIPNISLDKCNEVQRLELFTGLYKYEIKGHMKMIAGKKELKFVRGRVKHLQINVVVDEEYNLHRLFSLIEGFPCLEKLEIKFIWLIKPKYKHRRLDEDHVNRATTFDYLNTIKLSEFCGSIAELEFVLCIINNGAVLENLIVEGCASNCAIQQREIARSFKHLISVAPSFVDLILK